MTSLDVTAARRGGPGGCAKIGLMAGRLSSKVVIVWSPGNVDTPLYRQLLGAPPDGELPGPAPNPTGRVASADEIASYVACLLSDEAAFITGAALTIDGAATA